MMPTGTINIHCNTKTLVPIGVIAVQQSCVQAATHEVTITSRIRAGAAILAAATARENVHGRVWGLDSMVDGIHCDRPSFD